MSSREPISPELVLVAPDGGVEARAELPDRPWERYARPYATRPPRRVVIRAGVRPTAAGVVSPSPQRPRRTKGVGRVALSYAVLLSLAFAALTWAAERTPQPRLDVVGTQFGPRASVVDSVTSKRYVFPGGMLSLLGDPPDAVDVGFTRGCATGGSTLPIELVDGGFSFVGQLAGVAVRAVVRGVVDEPTGIALRIELAGDTCAEPPLDAVARPA